MSRIVRFTDVTPSVLDRVGGKGLNLSILTRAGFPVPPGFCVTTDAYRAVVGDALDALFPALVAVDADRRPELAAQARARILELPLPDDLVAEIATAYAALGPDAAVAVRSSATAEDLADASFAGQQDSYLNVVGADAVLDAVRRCWASLWNDRAVSYRATIDLAPDQVALAVVIQQMVPVAVAGVMFTADPVAGTRHHSVIDASPGLGEAVVSGAVTPDHFVVDTREYAVVDHRLADKRLVIRSVAGGGTERLDLESGDREACLDDDQLLTLARLGQRVQDHYTSPQDIEWALDEAGSFWLTQARPITTLYPQIHARPGQRAFLCVSLAQGLTRPITPMGIAAFRLIGTSVAERAGLPVADRLAGPPPFTVAGQRVFIDATAMLKNRVGRRFAARVFTIMEARTAVVLARLVDDPGFELVPVPVGRVLVPVLRTMLRINVPGRALTALVSPRAAYRQIDNVERRLRAELVVASGATPEQRLDHVERRLGTSVFSVMPTVIVYAAVGFALLGLARRLLRGAAEPAEVQTVLRGLPHNVTTEMDLDLWALTQQVRADPGATELLLGGELDDVAAAYRAEHLPQRLQAGLDGFLRRYGHRAVGEIDLGMPRWSDDPRHLLGMVRNYLRLDDPALAPAAQFAAGAAEAEAVIADLVERSRRRSALRARLVQFCLHRARQLGGLREKPKFLLVLGLAGMREQLQRVGQVLVETGRLDDADDVFFLDLADARRGLGGSDLRGLVTERRAAYDQELRRRHIPRVLLSDGTEPEAQLVATDAPEGALVGSPASAGAVTGTARVILDPVGAHLHPGEILVAPSTDPGWTPLFLTAGGLVMEMGGSNSHGAVVAREYGIPAVVGVPGATTLITSGQQVTVDGASGLVIPV